MLKMHCKSEPKSRTNEDIEWAKSLNQLAREQLKIRLLNDIRFDITVCQHEGRDYKEYLNSLKQIIDGFLKQDSTS